MSGAFWKETKSFHRHRPTPWFEGWIKPAHVGVYQRTAVIKEANTPVLYSYWDGKFWSLLETSPYWAERRRGQISDSQYLFWRGIVK